MPGTLAHLRRRRFPRGVWLLLLGIGLTSRPADAAWCHAEDRPGIAFGSFGEDVLGLTSPQTWVDHPSCPGPNPFPNARVQAPAPAFVMVVEDSTAIPAHRLIVPEPPDLARGLRPAPPDRPPRLVRA